MGEGGHHAMQSIGKGFYNAWESVVNETFFFKSLQKPYILKDFPQLFQQQGIYFWLPLGPPAKQSHCCAYLKKRFETAFQPSRETSQLVKLLLIIQREKLPVHGKKTHFSMLSISWVKNYPQGVSGLSFIQLFPTPTLILFYVCPLLPCVENVLILYQCI